MVIRNGRQRVAVGKNNNLLDGDRSKSFEFLRGNSRLGSLRQLLALENELKVSRRH